MKHQLVKESSNLFILHSPSHSTSSCELPLFRTDNSATSFSVKFNQSSAATGNPIEQSNFPNATNKQHRPNRSIWHTDHQPTFRINEEAIKTAHSNRRPPTEVGTLNQHSRFDSIKISYFLKLQLFTFIFVVFVCGQAQIIRDFHHLSGNKVTMFFKLFKHLTRRISSTAKLINNTAQFWIQILIIFNCLFTCNAIKNQYNKAVGAVHGDLVLGALFPVHHTPGPGKNTTFLIII